MFMSFFILEGLKWPAIILSIALAHIHHVRAMVNAVNVLHITAEWGSTGMFSSPKPGKKLMTGQLKISTQIIKRHEKA